MRSRSGRGGKDAVITGDLIHSPLQARYPELSMRVDYDQDSRPRRAANSWNATATPSTLCCFAHFPSPSRGHMKRWGDGFRCEFDVITT